jgi:drug/metabolite transporter (DMT)-like permease
VTLSNFGTAQWRCGVLMACTTSLLWGILPILLKLGLKEFSVETVAWSRFVFAFFVLGVWLRIRGKVEVERKLPWLGVLGGVII